MFLNVIFSHLSQPARKQVISTLPYSIQCYVIHGFIHTYVLFGLVFGFGVVSLYYLLLLLHKHINYNFGL